MKSSASKKPVWNRIFRYLRPDLGRFVLSLVLALFSVALTLYVPVLAGKAIDCIVSAGMIQFDRLSRYLLQILACILLSAVAQWIMTTINNSIAFHTVRDLRNDVFGHLQHLPLSYLDTRSTGDIVSRMVADVDTFSDGLLLGFSQLFTGALTIIGTLVFMLTIHPLITLVVVLITPLSLLVARFIATRTHDMFVAQSKARGAETALVDEVISGQKLVQTFGLQEQMLKRFDELNANLHDCSLKATFFSSLTNPCTRFVNSMVYAAVALAGALTALTGGLSIGALTSFLSYANQYTKPFNEISGVMTELQNAVACAERLFNILDTTAETPDPAVPHRSLSGEIRAEHISFSYTPDKPLIEDLSFSAKPGQRVAIVGPTGCGKTTVINLLMRFYDVNKGSISVDGIDTRSLKRTTLRRNIGMVLQDTWLFAGTIRENIAVGKPDATDEEIIRAAKEAHAHSFIRRLPNGYDTVIGESGGQLSQGQKQLLCITRLMLAPPPMLILDEATSSIDVRTEQRIQRAFSKLMQGRTSIIVAHRLSTIRSADLILVMKDGNVIEQGNHRSLLEQNGFYAKLYNSQFEQ